MNSILSLSWFHNKMILKFIIVGLIILAPSWTTITTTTTKTAIKTSSTSILLATAFQSINTKSKYSSYTGSSNSLHESNKLGRRKSGLLSPNSKASSLLIMALGPPKIDNWQITGNGNVVGIVSNHPTIGNGDVITTSPIKNSKSAKMNSIVTTSSGSKYKLGEQRGKKKLEQEKKRKKELLQQQKKQLQQQKEKLQKMQQQKQQQKQQKNKNDEQKQSKKTPLFSFGGGGGSKKIADTGSINPSPAAKKAAPSPKKRITKKVVVPPQELSLANVKIQYQLTGLTVGPDEKYLLVEKPSKSTSGKSFIYKAYKNDNTGRPIGEAVTIKISANQEALEREAENYAKISNSGFVRGKFVDMYEYLSPEDLETTAPKFQNQCAVVMERGETDLKRYINENGPFSGKGLRSASCAAAECVQAAHRCGMVWTDLKSENFVVLPGSNEVRGIDLESARPCRENPVDYSPEACPPEFAESFLEGEASYFELQCSYDVWSLGMLFCELATGRGYFDGKKPLQITKLLSKAYKEDIEYQKKNNFLSRVVSSNANDDDKDTSSSIYPSTKNIVNSLNDYGDEVDPRFKDLIERCLQINPRKRPNIQQILLHPYFLTTGFGPFSF